MNISTDIKGMGKGRFAAFSVRGSVSVGITVLPLPLHSHLLPYPGSRPAGHSRARVTRIQG